MKGRQRRWISLMKSRQGLDLGNVLFEFFAIRSPRGFSFKSFENLVLIIAISVL